MVESRNDISIITSSENYFKSLNFMLRTLAEKVQIKDRGRVTPDLNQLQPVVKESYMFSCLACYYK